MTDTVAIAAHPTRVEVAERMNVALIGSIKTFADEIASNRDIRSSALKRVTT